VRVLVVDNYDSFTHNLVQPLRAWGCEVVVRRNDALSVAEARRLAADRVVLSPGPDRPEQAGACVDLVRAAAADEVPLLGVCLGHQCLAVAFGARVVRARRPLHGRASPIHHTGVGVLEGLASPFPAARYHSLVVSRRRLPRSLEATAWSEEGELMALRHVRLPLEGVQFHPESYLTPDGEALLRNFVGLPRAARGPRRERRERRGAPTRGAHPG